MAASTFTAAQWAAVAARAATDADGLGLPERRPGSVVIGTFNIRELSEVANRPDPAWDFLRMICGRFDLLAIQEVGDHLEGLRHIHAGLGDAFHLAVSDMTGVLAGERGNPERLAFLYRWERVRRTEVASDITYDRSWVLRTLYDERDDFAEAWEKHHDDYQFKLDNRPPGGKKPKEPPLVPPHFVTFIRQPHVVSFEIPGGAGADPYRLLVVNAHLLYGQNALERAMEFWALLDWLTRRAKQKDRTYHDNFLLLGDLNLEFEQADIERSEVDDHLRALNTTVLRSKKEPKVNFPLLSTHPVLGDIRTNVRRDQTYDQIAFFAHDPRLPTPDDNDTAGGGGPDGYDYGFFDFVELVRRAVPNLGNDTRVARIKHDISDHMPAWVRLPLP